MLVNCVYFYMIIVEIYKKRNCKKYVEVIRLFLWLYLGFECRLFYFIIRVVLGRSVLI